MNDVLCYMWHKYQVKQEACVKPLRGIYYIDNPCKIIIIMDSGHKELTSFDCHTVSEGFKQLHSVFRCSINYFTDFESNISACSNCKVQKHFPQLLPTKSSFNFLLKIPIQLVVFINHYPRIYKRFHQRETSKGDI